MPRRCCQLLSLGGAAEPTGWSWGQEWQMWECFAEKPTPGSLPGVSVLFPGSCGFGPGGSTTLSDTLGRAKHRDTVQWFINKKMHFYCLTHQQTQYIIFPEGKGVIKHKPHLEGNLRQQDKKTKPERENQITQKPDLSSRRGFVASLPSTGLPLRGNKMSREMTITHTNLLLLTASISLLSFIGRQLPLSD